MNGPTICLTNDDGIDATGLRVVRDALQSVADVTVVAPAENQSGVGCADSLSFAVEERPIGYAVDGTPTDCVQFARGGLDRSFDLVVSGCNDGPNLGAHRVQRSGTIGAAMEAAHFGIPGVALSVFDPPNGVREFYPEDFELAGDVARHFTQWIARSELPPGADYFNVNVPADPPDVRMRITEPVYDYDVRIDETEDDEYRAWDHFYDPLHPEVDVEMTDPVGTDRRSVHDEEISVSPLSIRHRTPDRDELDDLVDGFRDRFAGDS